MTSTQADAAAAAATPRHGTSTLFVLAALGAVASVIAWLGVIGSDALWLSALGDAVRLQGSVPQGVPFATASTQHWVNTTVLGQLLFSLFFEMGSVGILLAQLVAAVTALGVLAHSALTRGARPTSTAAVIALVAVGAASPLLIARAQMLSLIPYAILLAVLRRQHAKPTPGIWWAVPLIAIWGNLHGAVLVGVAILGCYLVASRFRISPATSVAVGMASLVATCLNPGLLDAIHYYTGVFGGQATSDDAGMWSRLSLTSPLDILLILTAGVLTIAALLRRPPLWESAAGLGLILATIAASRHGVWLLLFLAVPAATGLGGAPPTSPVPSAPPAKVLRATLVAAFVIISAASVTMRAPSFRAADNEAAQIAAATRGRIVLAPEPLAESLAAAGATVWASNPLDAFRQRDQAAFLAFTKGNVSDGRLAFGQSDVVVASPGSPQALAAADAGFTTARQVGSYLLLSPGSSTTKR